MKKVGVRKVWFRGRRGYFERLVWKNEEDGTYWISWYHESVQVRQRDGFEVVSDGWYTIKEY